MALDNASYEEAQVMQNRYYPHAAIGELVLHAPACAQTVQPGQFVHIQLKELEAHILRRPFSVYQADSTAQTITLLYQVVGEGTRHMSELAKDTQMSLLGPVGRGWNPQDARRALLVGGGVGAAPLYLLASALYAQKVEVELVLGAASAKLLVCQKAFEALLGTKRIHITTDDGSRGRCGFATKAVETLLSSASYDYLAVCGPTALEKATVILAQEAKVRAEVSLERRMACGIGACLSCVVTSSEGQKRVCVDGPVFESDEVLWCA